MCCAPAQSVRPSGMSVRPFTMSVRPFGISVRLSSLAVCLSICVSAFSPHDDTFRYQLLNTRRSEACTMCFGDECWTLQKDRCSYYAEVTEAMSEMETGISSGGEVDILVHDMVGQDECWTLQKDRCNYYAEVTEAMSEGKTGIFSGREMDGLVHDMVGQAAASWISQECIPYVSQHTDCNKENICVGCQTCSCEALGKWNCKSVQRCRAEPDLDVDHRILVSVAENMKDENASRKKRSIDNKTKKPEAPQKISYAEIAEWMYGVKPNIDENTENTGRENKEIHLKSSSTTTATTVKLGNIDTDTDIIEFDEVLKNIAIDNQEYRRRKPQLNETNYEFNDYMDLEETTVVKNNETDQFVNILNAIIDENEKTTVNPIIEESTKVVIDLLVPSKPDENSNVSNYIDLSSNIIKEENYADDSNDTLQFDAINIMKRDVSSMMQSNSTLEDTSDQNTNSTKSVNELKNNVLIPLTKIIDDKQQELKDLMKIKDNLIQFINDYNKTNLDLNVKSQEVINSTNTVLSIYNLDIFPEIQFNLRKINPNSMDKLLYKLKRDIYEVIRDIVVLKKYSKTNNLPDDLRDLARAMSIYIRKQGNVTSFAQNGIKFKNVKNLRRQQNNEYNYNFNSTNDYVVKILEVLDKDKPQSDALSSLSAGTRKIIKRVIKNHYTDDFSVIGLRVYDPEYNLTNDLRNIGSKWQRLTENVATSAPANKIYAMKLLHFILSVDINKLNDALALIDFAHSRRMIPIEGSLGEELLDKINRGLKSIDEKIQIIMNYRSGNNLRVAANPTVKPSKRKSFLNKIRNLLRGSKRDIVELVNKKVPRSEIVKTIAKKRLDEIARKKITEFEETMRKWQNTLNVIPRYKRSLDLTRSKNRLKNIIPKYLRGKLNPALAAKQLKKTRQYTQNKATLKEQTTTKQRKIVMTTAKTQTEVTKRNVARNINSSIKKTKPIQNKIKPRNKVKAKPPRIWRL